MREDANAISCKHPSHNKYRRKTHVLLCEEHKDTAENKRLLEEYKSRCISKDKLVELSSYSKDIKLSFLAESTHDTRRNASNSTVGESRDFPARSDKEVAEKAIYQLHNIT